MSPSSPSGADISVVFQLPQPQKADSERAFEQLNQIQTRLIDSSPCGNTQGCKLPLPSRPAWGTATFSGTPASQWNSTARRELTR